MKNALKDTVPSLTFKKKMKTRSAVCVECLIIGGKLAVLEV